MRILVVDDEELLVKGIKFNLESEGYDVDVCYDGKTAVSFAKNNEYSLIILDLMMPVMNGLEACQEIRMFSTVPIIMLTAKSEDSDILMGFESGADDYITKPFNILELKARVRALIRRAGLASVATAGNSVITYKEITIDPEKRTIIKSGADVPVTMKEFDLVLFLLKNAGKVYSRDSLLDLVWGSEYEGDPRTVDVHIRRIREKLENDSANPEFIMTKWGVGYYFAD